MLGGPGGMTVIQTTGPFVIFSTKAGLFMSAIEAGRGMA